MNVINSEEAAIYKVAPVKTTNTNMDDEIIDKALAILARRLRKPGEFISSPADLRRYATLRWAKLEHEVFSIVYLDNRHRVIEVEELFRGTIDGAAVYPREVVKSSLKHNAACVVLIHNHPSGVAEPSRADEQVTIKIKEALATVDIRVLDHLIVAGADTLSFAERGLM